MAAGALKSPAAVLARFHVDAALAPHVELDMPEGAARHMQVLRLQPGAPITLFDGRGGEWDALVLAMARTAVRVRIDAFRAVDRELALRVTLAFGMPANERMDGLIEKATELGASVVQPLHCERSVLRLTGERAARKVAHWQAVARSACEQCGRTRLPQIAPVRSLLDWLAGLPLVHPDAEERILLSALTPVASRHAPRVSEGPMRDPGGPANLGAARRCGAGVAPMRAGGGTPELISLSGPEGGLTEDEQRAARQCGFAAWSLGPRTLRADTAPLALLAHLAFEMEHCCEEPG